MRSRRHIAIALALCYLPLLWMTTCGGNSAFSGSMDTTFSADGKLTIAIGAFDDIATSGVIQSDGKLIVAGATNDGIDWNFAVARINSDGTVDTAFGSSGSVVIELSANQDDIVNAVAIQTDGKLLLAGSLFNGTNKDYAIVRLNTDGSLDTSFGNAGIVTQGLGGGDDEIQDIGLQPDGKVVVAGHSQDLTNLSFSIARYSTNGILDSTFTTSGFAAFSVSTSSDDKAFALDFQNDRKILLAGVTHNGENNDFAVVRVNTDGTLDSQFAQGGNLITDFGQGNDEIRALLVQSDGKLLAAGFSSIGERNSFAIARYLSNGTLDQSLNSEGTVNVSTVCESSSDEASAVAVSNTQIILAGTVNPGINSSCEGITTTEFGLARLSQSGVLTRNFGTNGTQIVNFGREDTVRDMIIQPDNKIVVFGFAQNGSNSDFAIARLNQ